MDIVFGLSFGSRLHSRNPAPGLSNEALALQIVEYTRMAKATHPSVRHAEKESTFVIADVPIAIAMNSTGEYPDRIISTSGEGVAGMLGAHEFFIRAVGVLGEERMERRYEQVRYFLAAQSVCQPRALALAQALLHAPVVPLSDEPVVCDPDAHPWYTRSLLRAKISEHFAVFAVSEE